MSDPFTIPDEKLGFLILGWLRGAMEQDNFPLYVQQFSEEYDDQGDVASFIVVLRSGNRYRVAVEFVPPKGVT